MNVSHRTTDSLLPHLTSFTRPINKHNSKWMHEKIHQTFANKISLFTDDKYLMCSMRRIFLDEAGNLRSFSAVLFGEDSSKSSTVVCGLNEKSSSMHKWWVFCFESPYMKPGAALKHDTSWKGVREGFLISTSFEKVFSQGCNMTSNMILTFCISVLVCAELSTIGECS